MRSVSVAAFEWPVTGFIRPQPIINTRNANKTSAWMAIPLSKYYETDFDLAEHCTIYTGFFFFWLISSDTSGNPDECCYLEKPMSIINTITNGSWCVDTTYYTDRTIRAYWLYWQTKQIRLMQTKISVINRQTAIWCVWFVGSFYLVYFFFASLKSSKKWTKTCVKLPEIMTGLFTCIS